MRTQKWKIARNGSQSATTPLSGPPVTVGSRDGIMVDLVAIALSLMRLVVFGLALGLTVISFQAYRQRGSQRLEYAFIGFAFISMGVALMSVTTQLCSGLHLLQIGQTIPLIVGFSMLYASLYG